MIPDPHLALFEAERRRLAGLAYRMTGSVSDSEDVVHEAWIRWSRQDIAQIEAPSRWLGAVVTRLCLDHLKSARHRRETYVGAWLPDPLVQDDANAERDWIVSEDVSIALVLTLETLSPEMRADSDEAAPLFRDDCAPGFRDDLAPCFIGVCRQ